MTARPTTTAEQAMLDRLRPLTMGHANPREVHRPQPFAAFNSAAQLLDYVVHGRLPRKWADHQLRHEEMERRFPDVPSTD